MISLLTSALLALGLADPFAGGLAPRSGPVLRGFGRRGERVLVLMELAGGDWRYMKVGDTLDGLGTLERIDRAGAYFRPRRGAKAVLVPFGGMAGDGR